MYNETTVSIHAIVTSQMSQQDLNPHVDISDLHLLQVKSTLDCAQRAYKPLYLAIEVCDSSLYKLPLYDTPPVKTMNIRMIIRRKREKLQPRRAAFKRWIK